MAPALLRVSYCPEEQPSSCAVARPHGLAELYQQPLPLQLTGTTASKAELSLPLRERYLKEAPFYYIIEYA